MKKRHLFWILLPSYWLLMAVAILVMVLYASNSMKRLYYKTLETDIRTRATLFAQKLSPEFNESDTQALDALCKQMGTLAETRFTIILADGKVAGDSVEDPIEMENHGRRPEIQKAFSGHMGKDERLSDTLGKEMMYLAVPLYNDNHEILCAVRAALPMTDISGALNTMRLRIVIASLLTGILAMGVCIVVVRRITSPLQQMGGAARRFAEGDFKHRIPVQQTYELDQLADSLNTMSEQLSKTLSTLSEQRNEQAAVLSSMNEGVLAIDKKERIIHMNRVAGEILGVDSQNSKKTMVAQTIRYANLQEYIKSVIGAQKPSSRDLTLRGKTEKQIQAGGTVLKNAKDESIGALIVLRDVTQLRHLETVRSDFVANVSHELKTPITSIKGFVETLLADDWEHNAETRRFLDIINQQAGRLNAIIDDLLTLSRLEQKEGHVIIKETPLADVIESSIYLCQLHAGKKNIKVDMDCPADLTLPINAPLLEQALVNLIVNAIKYSEPDKKVLVLAEKQEKKALIYVKDDGFGIEQKHLDRLFERFYRVDTARSRKLGGTGLGLSIVKHIVQVHKGNIRVESKLGAGSTFIIELPLVSLTALPIS
ncbi:MAG: HAMP domain-containing protein [Pontiellaceae bacterium]|nr:HAMP domain-containing protein [Pontiellaceae bacterium]